jgi:hypothetical protein
MGEMFRAISNFSAQPASVEADTGAINGSNYQDVESGKTGDAAGGRMGLKLAGYGHRIFRIDSENAPSYSQERIQ